LFIIICHSNFDIESNQSPTDETTNNPSKLIANPDNGHYGTGQTSTMGFDKMH